MRKSELMLKMMMKKLSIKFSDLDAWLLPFGFSQQGVHGLVASAVSFPVCN